VDSRPVDIETAQRVAAAWVGYLHDKQVRGFLHLTPEQEEASDALEAGAILSFDPQGPAVPEEVLRRIEDDVRDTGERLRRILNEGQIKILRQIELQGSARNGLRYVLLRKDVVVGLELTETQVEKMRSVTRSCDETRAKLRALFRRGKSDGSDLRRLDIHEEEELLSSLTPRQRERWREMLGPHYDIAASYDTRDRASR
jgi:hypothetical protein